MAKKSFLIYIDSLDILDELSDEEAGRLFKAIKSAQKGEECELDPVTRIALSPFKSQFARDLEKYESICERNKNNGLKGGRPKTEENPKNPVGSTGGEDNPKNLDSDSDSDSEKNKDVGDKSPVPLQQVLDAYHELLPMMPRVQIYTDKRKSMVRIFWKKRSAEHRAAGKVFTIESLRGYFSYIANHCQWMLTDRDNGKGGMWKAKNFDYVMKDDCYVAVKEQRFDNKGNY
ncbi:hypothetical protein ZP9_00051 [Shewanella phage ZP9]|nr:hypothetical protein ZP9_00051 [Shewanella phage ZP9]